MEVDKGSCERRGQYVHNPRGFGRRHKDGEIEWTTVREESYYETDGWNVRGTKTGRVRTSRYF